MVFCTLFKQNDLLIGSNDTSAFSLRFYKRLFHSVRMKGVSLIRKYGLFPSVYLKSFKVNVRLIYSRIPNVCRKML